MADEAPAQAATESTATAAAPAAEQPAPQPDLSNPTLEQLDTLFTTGSAEMPTKDSEVQQTGTEAATQPASAAQPTGDTPPAATDGTPAEPAPAAQTTEQPTGEQPVGTTEPAQPTTEPDDEKGGGLPERFRHKDPTDRAINAVYKAAQATGAPISWAEAERRVKGDPAPQQTTTTTAATDKPETGSLEDLQQAVETLPGEIEDIKRQLVEAGEGEGLFTKDIAELQAKLTEKTADLRDARRDLRDATRAQEEQAAVIREESETARSQAHAKAIELYPEAGDVNTPLGKAVSDRIAALKDKNHPDHALLYTDSAPLTIVRDVAADLNIAPKAKAAVATPVPAQAAAPAQPKVVVPPVPGNRTSVPAATQQVDAKQTEKYLREAASLQELDALFTQGKVAVTV